MARDAVVSLKPRRPVSKFAPPERPMPTPADLIKRLTPAEEAGAATVMPDKEPETQEVPEHLQTVAPLVPEPEPEPVYLMPECSMCPLRGQKPVLSQWFPQGHIAIVGEAPAALEVRDGIPFVGQSGRLLWATLKGLGLEGQICLVTNSVMCQVQKTKGETVSPEAIQQCNHRLIRELAQSKASHVLLLGNTAIQAMGGPYKVSTMRGRTWSHKDLPGVALKTSFHPAAVLRRSEMFRDFAEDLGRIMEPDRVPPRVQTAVVRPDEVEFVCQELMATPLLACDIESSGFLFDRDKILCVSFAMSDSRAVTIPENMVTHPAVVKVLREHQGLLFHNGKFDVLFLERTTGVRPHIAEDSMILSYSLDERTGKHGLKELITSLLPVDNWESEVHSYLKKKGDSYLGVPRPVLYKYAGVDAAYTVWLYNYLKPLAEAETARGTPVWPLYRKLVRYANLLLLIERYGMMIDMETLRKTREEWTVKMAEIVGKIQEYAPGLNPASSVQLARLLFDQLGYKPIKKRSTNAETLAILAERHNDPALHYLVELRHLKTLTHTYLDNLEKLADKDGRVHPSLQLHGSVTGRLACSRPNLLNIPRSSKSKYAAVIRKLFVAPPGYQIMEADFSQAEMRVLAITAQEPFLMTTLTQGLDIHYESAKLIYGGGRDKFTTEERNTAKMFNFGLVYGRSAVSIAMERGITIKQANIWYNQFYERMPNLVRWQSKIRNQVREEGQLTTSTLRTRRFPLVTEENWIDIRNQAINFPIQSISSEIALEALVRLVEDPFMLERNARPLLMVHDSILLEVKEGDEEIGPHVIHVMTECAYEILGRQIPSKVDTKTGPSWGLTKSD